MEIKFLPSDFVINVSRKVGSLVESDFLIRTIRIKNTSSELIEITGYRFDVKIKGKIVKQILYPREILKSLAKSLKANLGNITDEIRMMMLGTDGFWDDEAISETPVLEPGQKQGVLLESLVFLHKDPVDECVFTVFYTQNNAEKSASMVIPVKEYINKNSYIFPLKGAWLVVNNYDDHHVHRRSYSQEFGVDLAQYTKDFHLFAGVTGVTSVTGEQPENEDFPSYGSEIYAVADGEVIDCFDGIPENPPGLGSRLPEEEWDKIRAEHGFVPWAAGNYVTIKHQGREYTFYAHMIPGSLTVGKGEKVSQGQVIGKLGNSGNSDCPHLHFHLMAGPSILTARGLPCRFSNLKDAVGESLEFIGENNSIVHAE